jgi:exonuclease SbcD
VISGVAVASMPWPRKANVDAAGADAREVMRSVLRGLGDQLAEHDGPRVLLSHAMVRGSRTSTGQELMGCELEVGLEDLALARADLYALGHVHAHQSWDVAGAPAIYPGSPRRANFGELEPKGYVVAGFDGRRLVGWEFVPTPATRMLHLEAGWYSEHVGLPGDVVVPAGFDRDWETADVAGAETRFRYHVEPDQRDAARREAQLVADELRARGAVAVKLEELVVATTRARAPEIARAATLADKLRALWAARNDDPPPEREAGLMIKLSSLEGSP